MFTGRYELVVYERYESLDDLIRRGGTGRQVRVWKLADGACAIVIKHSSHAGPGELGALWDEAACMSLLTYNVEPVELTS